MDRSDLAVVIPCHNEAATIGEVVREARRHADVIVVDDRSTDGSGQAARAGGARVVDSASRGYDGALDTGLRQAWTDGYRFVVTMDADGEHDILRDNMPFGRPGAGEFGTYFIGYSARLWVTMRMIDRMFIGDPPGFHDKILDASTAVTGSTFFAPSNPVLQALDDPDSLAASLLNLRKTTSQPAAGTDAPVGSPDGSLGIGSLRRAHDGESAADETEGTAS